MLHPCKCIYFALSSLNHYMNLLLLLSLLLLLLLLGARGSVVGWGTMLQAGRSRVRFPVRSLDTKHTPTIPTCVFQWLQRRRFLVTLTLQKALQPPTCGSHYVPGCRLTSVLQETNGSPLLSNTLLVVASELNKNPEQRCITTAVHRSDMAPHSWLT
jgi:hypothetical protein